MPDDGTSAAVKRGRRVALQLVEEARGQVAGAIQSALSQASDCVARVTGRSSDQNIYSQDGNITLQANSSLRFHCARCVDPLLLLACLTSVCNVGTDWNAARGTGAG